MKKEKISKKHLQTLKNYGIEKAFSPSVNLFRYDSGEFICLQGSAIEHIYIFLRGKAKVFFTSPNGKTLLMAYYTEIGLIGDAELMRDSDEATSSVQAITPVECIAIPLEHHKDYLKSNIKFMNVVGAGLANKLNSNTINSTFNILHSLDSRLCAYIDMTNKNGVFKEKLTELSEILGTSYRHLLRTFEKLCTEGILDKTRGGYVVLDMKKLREKVGED